MKGSKVCYLTRTGPRALRIFDIFLTISKFLYFSEKRYWARSFGKAFWLVRGGPGGHLGPGGPGGVLGGPGGVRGASGGRLGRVLGALGVFLGCLGGLQAKIIVFVLYVFCGPGTPAPPPTGKRAEAVEGVGGRHTSVLTRVWRRISGFDCY